MIQGKKNKPVPEFIFWTVRTKLLESKVFKMYKDHASWNRYHSNIASIRCSQSFYTQQSSSHSKHRNLTKLRTSVLQTKSLKIHLTYTWLLSDSAYITALFTTTTKRHQTQLRPRPPISKVAKNTVPECKEPPGCPFGLSAAYSPWQASLEDFLPLPLHLRTMRENGEQFQH